MNQFALEKSKDIIEESLVKAYLQLFASANGAKKALINNGMDKNEAENLILTLNENARKRAMNIAETAEKIMGES